MTVRTRCYRSGVLTDENFPMEGSCIDVLNARLNRWETIKEFRIDHDLSVEGDELTPSLKVRRQVMEARYRPLLDAMYASQRRG